MLTSMRTKGDTKALFFLLLYKTIIDIMHANWVLYVVCVSCCLASLRVTRYVCVCVCVSLSLAWGIMRSNLNSTTSKSNVITYHSIDETRQFTAMVGHQSPRGSFSFSCIYKAIRRTPPPSTPARCETNVRKLSSPCQTFRLDVDSRALPNVLWSHGDGLCHTTCRRLITAQTFIKSSSLVATSVTAPR